MFSNIKSECSTVWFIKNILQISDFANLKLPNKKLGVHLEPGPDLWAETLLRVWVKWPFNAINPVGKPEAAEHQRIFVFVSCVPADKRVAGLIPWGVSASGRLLLLIWTTTTHTPILRRMCVTMAVSCVCAFPPESGSIMFFFCFSLHSSEQLRFKSLRFLGWSCLVPRVFFFFGRCGSQLSQNAFHTPPAAEWRCFSFPSRDYRSISEDSSSCRAESRACEPSHWGLIRLIQ